MRNPHIVQCGNLFFFTVHLPPGVMSELIPSHIAGTEIIGGGDKDYFVLMISGLSSLGTMRDEVEQEALRHVWSVLVDRGVAEGELPARTIGDPLDMIQK